MNTDTFYTRIERALAILLTIAGFASLACVLYQLLENGTFYWHILLFGVLTFNLSEVLTTENKKV